jgi:energy-converting hydrogenase Eha subunit A
MNNVDIAMNLANVVNLIAVLLLMRAIIKDRKKLKGYSVSGTFLTFIAILGFEIGFYLMGNYISFVLGTVNLVFWFMAFVFNFTNFIQKRKDDNRK